MSSSNNDSIISTTNDSSLISSSSQLNFSDPLQTPPKQKDNRSANFNSILPQQQQQQQPSNSSMLFFNEDIAGAGTPINLSNMSFQQQLPSTAPPFLLLENSILRTETPDLDIDIALGDLNLDDYNDFLSQKQNFDQSNRSLLNFAGSMTPNAQQQQQQQQQQQSFNPSTPNWSTGVVSMPQTAPPFNHSGLNNSNPMLHNIKSFKLPDDDVEGDITTSSETQNTLSRQFGGSLLSTSSPHVSSMTSENKKGRRSTEPFEKIQESQQQVPPPHIMSGPPHPHHFQPMPFGSVDGFPPHPAFGSFPQQHSQPLTNNAPMWNNDYTGYMMGNNSSFPANPSQAPPPPPPQQQQQQQQFHHQHRRHQSQNNTQRWSNNGVNVHRNKMNRRKGEDPAKYANAKLEDFKGDIYSLCKDQHGCRFLQKQLDFNDELKTTLIFNETYLHIIELMVDPFGNYLIQKLLEKCNDQQRTVLVKNASVEFFKISTNPHGTRALQKLIECITTDEESIIIVKSLKPHIVTLARDLNGNHVVQKCLSKLSQEHNQFIFDISCDHCVEIATHRHGCCVLQRCLDFGSIEQCKKLGLVFSENVMNLSFDPFGNYVIQYILNNNDLIECKDSSITKILNTINANFIELSLHKFGSNVIEKILRLPKINANLIQLILNNLTIKEFNRLLNDSYGNYVLQTCLDVSNFENFEKLKKILIPILPGVKNTPHGRRISARLGINLSTLTKDEVMPVSTPTQIELPTV